MDYSCVPNEEVVLIPWERIKILNSIFEEPVSKNGSHIGDGWHFQHHRSHMSISKRLILEYRLLNNLISASKNKKRTRKCP